MKFNIVKMDRGTGKTATILKKALNDLKAIHETNTLPIILVSNYRMREIWMRDKEVWDSGLCELVHVRPETKEDILMFARHFLQPHLYNKVVGFECVTTNIKHFNVYIDDAMYNLTPLEAVDFYVTLSQVQTLNGDFNIELYETERA